MANEFAHLLDVGALAIVLAGTFLATLARCGWTDLRVALSSIVGLLRPGFDAEANRSALAKSVQEIDRTGPLCAEGRLPGDRALAHMIESYLRSGSREALHHARLADRAMRDVRRVQAVSTLEYAGELAPVFGLVGTLFAITQLAPSAGSDLVEMTMASIATAVLSSLYGVLAAHLVCIPLARAIDRKAEREEQARQRLIEWFDAQIDAGEHHRVGTIREVA